jgi:hypothetical protein
MNTIKVIPFIIYIIDVVIVVKLKLLQKNVSNSL